MRMSRPGTDAEGGYVMHDVQSNALLEDVEQNDLVSQQEMVHALYAGLRGRYPRLRLIETRISFAVLTGEYAYKMKKPVKLEFLDFTTLALCRLYCNEELRLNGHQPSALSGRGSITGPKTEPAINGAARSSSMPFGCANSPRNRCCATFSNASR